MKAISINLKMAVRNLQEVNMFTNMPYYGSIFMSEVELYIFHFINMDGFDFQLI